MGSRRQSDQFDIVLLADFTSGGDTGFRISQEIRCYADMGCRVGAVQLRANAPSAVISPDVAVCVREGLIDILPAEPSVRAGLAIVHLPSGPYGSGQDLSGIAAGRVVLVHDRKPDRKQMGQWLGYHFGPVSWAPTNRWVRAGLTSLGMPVPLLDEDWRPPGRTLPAPFGTSAPDAPLVFGRVSAPGGAQWPGTSEEVLEIYPIGEGRDFRIIGTPPGKLLNEIGTPRGLTIFEPADITVERLIEMIDVFFYFPSMETPAMPEAAIATAMASGKLVVLPPHLKPHFGPGAVYSDGPSALKTVADLCADNAALDAARKDASRHAAFQFSEADHKARVLSLLGRKRGRRTVKKRAATRPRALFVPSNGIGLGHVTRLLAIARRMDDEAEPVFASLARATDIIESFGYLSEYIPSKGDTGTDSAQWDAWFRHDLGAVIDRHDPEVVVFDGNNPTPGLIHAVLSRRRRGLVWVRRGMLGPEPSPHLENARFMDLIIEPGEIAGEWDTGPTTARRAEAVAVGPVVLLDRREILPRATARKQLGIAAEAPAVLLHLGGGANRDVVKLAAEIVEHLQRFPELQIFLAQWENSSVRFPDWAQTRVLRGFPISRYFNAFDFSVAAAGYNTFHEVMAFGLPTVFVANRHPAMDDQGTRAEYAQDRGAGFDLPEDQLFHLPALCQAMLDKRTRAFMRKQCTRLFGGNGASDAAVEILKLLPRG